MRELKRRQEIWETHPLYIGIIKQLLASEVSGVEFVKFTLKGRVVQDGERMRIDIGSGDTASEQAVTLIHEVGHIYFERLVGRQMRGVGTRSLYDHLANQEEELVEKEAKKFCKTCPDFTDRLIVFYITKKLIMKNLTPWFDEHVSLEKL